MMCARAGVRVELCTLPKILFLFPLTLHLPTMYSWTFGALGEGVREGDGGCCLYLTGIDVFGSVSLREPTCMVCTVCIWRCTVNTQGFVWMFLCAIYKCSFIHSLLHSFVRGDLSLIPAFK